MTAGVYPAAVTPFDERGAVDHAGVARLLAWFASNGCKGAVVAGTNGEGPSLSAPEKRELIRASVPLGEKLGLEVILGIASNSLDQAIWLCKQAKDSGAAAVLLMAPGYFREATEEGVEAWFTQVLDRSSVDTLVYNFPKRTGVTITPELMYRLAKHDRVIGLKDSSGSAENMKGYAQAVPKKLKYVGDETLLLDALQAGWTGTISGAANILPNWLSQVIADWETDQESARAKFELVLPGIKGLRGQPQPAANKAVLHHLGIVDNADLRLPLLPLAETGAVLDSLHPLLKR
jgi:4-hydroxy-tetrahydrodipicolinate synthase